MIAAHVYVKLPGEPPFGIECDPRSILSEAARFAFVYPNARAVQAVLIDSARSEVLCWTATRAGLLWSAARVEPLPLP